MIPAIYLLAVFPGGLCIAIIFVWLIDKFGWLDIDDPLERAERELENRPRLKSFWSKS